jgi:flagellar protein FliO/FliZ
VVVVEQLLDQPELAVALAGLVLGRREDRSAGYSFPAIRRSAPAAAGPKDPLTPADEGSESYPDSPSVMRIHPACTSAGAAVLGLLLLAPAALAADGERTPLNLSDSDSAPAQAAGSAGGGLVRTIVGLAVVIGVIYGLYWVLKQVKAAREDTASGSGLTTLATLPLGAKGSLHLVRAGDEVVLVGAGEHGVTAIRTYSEDEARALGLFEEETFEVLEEPASRKRGSLLDELRRRTVIR